MAQDGWKTPLAVVFALATFGALKLEQERQMAKIDELRSDFQKLAAAVDRLVAKMNQPAPAPAPTPTDDAAIDELRTQVQSVTQRLDQASGNSGDTSSGNASSGSAVDPITQPGGGTAGQDAGGSVTVGPDSFRAGA